jgi:hypothetical protein
MVTRFEVKVEVGVEVWMIELCVWAAGEELVVALVLVTEDERAARRGSFGGGMGIGGSACLVCSYRSATSPVSSRNGVRRCVADRRRRKLPNFEGAMAVYLFCFVLFCFQKYFFPSLANQPNSVSCSLGNNRRNGANLRVPSPSRWGGDGSSVFYGPPRATSGSVSPRIFTDSTSYAQDRCKPEAVRW